MREWGTPLEVVIASPTRCLCLLCQSHLTARDLQTVLDCIFGDIHVEGSHPMAKISISAAQRLWDPTTGIEYPGRLEPPEGPQVMKGALRQVGKWESGKRQRLFAHFRDQQDIWDASDMDTRHRNLVRASAGVSGPVDNTPNVRMTIHLIRTDTNHQRR
jgi:hypothetical protein